MATRTTRLAPSPTGALHLGNARTFLINWLLARRNNWRIVLRIEDLDSPRVKRDAATQAIEDLRWLCLDWDDGPIYQSDRLPIYRAAIDRLVADGKAYACVCSRREALLAASAPHIEDGNTIYPGTCRGRFASVEEARAMTGREPAIRFLVPIGSVNFVDAFAGPKHFRPADELGDFIIAKADGVAAYQLAVVVDDAAMGITEVVRGDDLLDSTPRQMLLYDALGLTSALPSYTHVPLVVGADGRRLAKRHGDSRISFYRKQGVTPGRVLALMARWCGIAGAGEEMTCGELLDQFRLSLLPRGPITFTPDDESRLFSGKNR